ncbi:MAG TPA: hypothetical protein VG406_01800 [Isosphaeraceae bacterium]|jgi:hypothetical protein|nr:hypothetical protein [Isosphaeraceae bacterium]
MATATTARKPRTIKAAHGTCGLTLSINGVRYRVRPLDGRGIGAARAFRLAKLAGDGEVYDLAGYPDGYAECDCPDWTFHRDGLDPAGCKHLAAARACGLIG